MDESKRKPIMSGNEAIARGALEAGVGFCASYPGTPSTEITARLFEAAEEHNIHVEWSTNEKVALESAAAASWVGIPAMSSMKSLGLNVASDFLLNLNLSGSGKGGLVIVVCDDPRGHSSSNEQDSRFFAKASQLPLLEPSTYQEAKDVTVYAFELSRRYEIPVIVRCTTRLSHSRGLVQTGTISKRTKRTQKIADGLFNVPTPHLKHRDLLEKKNHIATEFESSPFNMQHISKGDLLVITSGISSLYTQEAIQRTKSEIGHLNLVTTYPLPKSVLTSALEQTERVLFVEENDPFLEDEVRSLAAGLDKRPQFFGKENGYIPDYGEMNSDKVLAALLKLTGKEVITKERTGNRYKELVAERPLTFCAGCTHRNFYWSLRTVKKRLSGKLVVAGDIGCYSLGVFYDQAMDTMQAMGSGIGVGSGLGQLEQFGFDSKVVSLAGDSTFFHSCLPGLINARHKNADLTFVILDNATTAMTGFQEHPGSSTQSKNLHRVEIENLLRAIEPDHFVRGDATDIPALTDLLHSTVQKEGLKVILLDSVCRLEEVKRKPGYVGGVPVKIDRSLCKGEKCKICVADFACPALSWESDDGYPVVLDHACVQCGACIAVCPYKAIVEDE